MIEGIRGCPSHARKRLASALEAGLIAAPYSPSALRALLGLQGGVETIIESLNELDRAGIVGKGAAAWIRALEEVAAQALRPDLVWSGPEVPGVHARDTRRVYEELLGSAESSLWVSTYAFFDGPRAFDVLARRMDATPGLGVTLLLNIERKRGDTTALDQLVRKFADRFWSLEWPGTARPQVFYDPRALDLDAPGGVLHAKAVVADDDRVFVTSANFTEAAWERNIELGLLVRDRVLAGSIVAHFRGLIETAVLRPLPGA